MTKVDRTVLEGLAAFVLENDALRVTVLPQPGAKIYSLYSKQQRREVLWHNPRIRPQPYPVDANFDNYYCGGWDEGFPTCDACEFAGEQFPNLGELRSIAWRVETLERAGANAVIQLEAFAPINPVKARKTVTLCGDDPVVRVESQFENVGVLPLPFIWGTHPALNADADTRLRITAKTGIVAQSAADQLGKPGQIYKWPSLPLPGGHSATDMSRVLARESGLSCAHFVRDLEADWYAVENESSGDGFLLKFGKAFCPILWLWLSYGGWRGYHHVIVEPWTSMPVNLAEAHRQGTSRTLAPGQTFTAEVEAVIYSHPSTWRDALRLGGQ